jgi:hypothetical protein
MEKNDIAAFGSISTIFSDNMNLLAAPIIYLKSMVRHALSLVLAVRVIVYILRNNSARPPQGDLSGGLILKGSPCGGTEGRGR